MEMPVPPHELHAPEPRPTESGSVLFHQRLGSGAQRVGESERSATCDVLAAHYAAGRLSGDEFDQRVTLALRSLTLSELWQLTADLPLSSATGPHSPVPQVRDTGRPRSGAAWPALSVLAVLGLVGSLLLAGTMLLVLGVVQPVLFVGAAIGGLAAATGGASLCYLVTTHLQVRR
ncbi:hypothetical protein GCM10011575_45980 [Microlunatus endophyticus]|uniref:DUF1707 domain-containing protein n=1 Tax=Microlunatus endophyticus TaxID=1716077 RepID=A0A917SJ09_9ACTN|nr:DUF1707 domain-containing protein [Microlunatus endophyticus]GGL82529.1 hypothetical protein GCM10011575_45980 [Microlunatus endophyticus]